MANIVRVALPTYNALTDTDPDHFSLIADDDNVLLKEKTRGTVTIPAFGVEAIAHNLGYVPDFKCAVNDVASAYLKYGWKMLGNQNSSFFANSYTATADVNYLYLVNNTSSSAVFVYKINYDEQAGSGTPSFTPSNQGIFIARDGKSAESTNPNDFIMHSDLNSEPILKQGVSTISFTTSGDYTITHGLSLTAPCEHDLFVKFPDGKVVNASGENAVISRDRAFEIRDVIITTTQIKFTINRLTGSGSASIPISWYIFDLPLNSDVSGVEINLADHLMRVSKDSYNVLTELNSSRYKFLSGFNYLKYYAYGDVDMTIIGDRDPMDLASGTLQTSEIDITHGLGYVPYFKVYCDDFKYFPNDSFAQTPYANVTFGDELRSEAYADSNKIYLKMFNRSPNTYTATFYYKLYLNNLGF